MSCFIIYAIYMKKLGERRKNMPNQPELNIVHEPESVVINDFYAKKG
jgi:hypothetical protein